MTDDPEFVDLPTKTRYLFKDICAAIQEEDINAFDYGDEHDEQPLPGDRIGWQVDVWERDGDAVWRVTVEAVGSPVEAG